jgi:hypothetical protein
MLCGKRLPYLILCSVSALAVAGASAPPTRTPTQGPSPSPPVNDETQRQQAAALFSRMDLFDRVPPNPLGLAGAVAWTDPCPDGKVVWQYTRLLPERSLPDAKFENQIIFQSLVDKGWATEVGYLAVVGVKLGKQDRAEAIIENVYTADGPGYLDEDVQTALLRVVERFKQENRVFYYIEAIRYTTVKFKTYRRVEGTAHFGFFVNIGGRYYHTNENFQLTPLVGVQMIRVDNSGEFLLDASKKPERVDVGAKPDPLKGISEFTEATKLQQGDPCKGR